MQTSYDMWKENISDQLPLWASRAKHDVLRSIRDNGIVAFMGLPTDFCGYDFGDVGRLRVAKLVVKEAMSVRLFDKVIWISSDATTDWSVKNVQLIIMKSYQLEVIESKDDDEDADKHWNEEDACRRINNLLVNQRLLIVLEDPPEESTDLIAVGVPSFYKWTPFKLLVVTRSVTVCKLMRAQSLNWLPVEDWSQLYDLIKSECFDIACLPRFRICLSQDTVLSCFKSLCLTPIDEGSKQDIVFYWVGEGLLEVRSSPNKQSDTLTDKSIIGNELLSEFKRRGLLYFPKHDDDGFKIVSSIVYDACNFYDDSIIIVYLRSKYKSLDQQLVPAHVKKLKWITYRGGDALRISYDCPYASTLVLNYSFIEEIADDVFNHLNGLRVLDMIDMEISSVPASLAHLSKSLKVLLMRSCRKIKEFPSAIQSLEFLEILDMSSCKIKGSSSSFSFQHLDKLKYLNLSNNHFSSLPQSVCNLCNLEEFNLSGNIYLIQLPEASFQFMKKLFFLDLSGAKSFRSLPSSISACINLKTFLLKDCNSLEIGVSHLYPLKNLETLDLSGCCSLLDASTFKPVLPNLQNLNLSGVLGLIDLSLRGCPDLKEVTLRGCSKLEELDLSGTKIQRFPSEAFSQGSCLKRFYMLGNLSLLKVDWECMKRLPTEIFYVDECCDVAAVERLQQLQDQTFISVRNPKTFFGGYQHLLEIVPRLNIIISPCDEQENKGNYVHFQSEHFRYKQIYRMSSSPSSPTTAIKLSPNTHFAQFGDRSRSGRNLQVKGGSRLKGQLNGGFLGIQFFSMFNNDSVRKLSDFGIENMQAMRECWLEKCHRMEIVFVEDSKSRGYKSESMMSLETLWVSNLSRLTNVSSCGGRRFEALKHLNLEYCPKLVNVFIFSSPQEAFFKNLETLEIRFCARMEDVFVEKAHLVTDQVSHFPRLHTLCLWELSSLKTIARPEVSFPNLKKVRVRGCPILQTLPIHFNKAAQRGGEKIEIEGEWEWWKNIKWAADDEIVKDCINFTGWKHPNKKVFGSTGVRRKVIRA